MKKRSLFVALAILAGGVAASGSLRADVFKVTEDWSIEITPAQKVANSVVADSVGTTSATDSTAQVVEEAAVSDPAVVSPGLLSVNAEAYQQIYRSIPFNRAEYNANPNYRHDSTMEILTGNARHQTIVRHETPRPRPAAQTNRGLVPYRYNNPARGLNYYFYFPYWNYRGIY